MVCRDDDDPLSAAPPPRTEPPDRLRVRNETLRVVLNQLEALRAA